MNRRQFLSQAFSAVAAGGLSARVGAADAAGAAADNAHGPLIDTHVYLGHWPHARLAGEAPGELVEMLRRNSVVQAWAGSFEGLFHKDIAAVNDRLAEACAKHGNGLLVPLGTVNIALPDWEEDLRRCHETHRMPGIRVHPSYHGYTLADPRFGQLLARAGNANLLVQLVVRLDDKWRRWLAPVADAVEPSAVAGMQPSGTQPAIQPRLTIAGTRAAEIASWTTAFAEADICVELPRAFEQDRPVGIDSLAALTRLVFGSGAPLGSIESARAILANANFGDERRRAIERGLAEQLIGRR